MYVPPYQSLLRALKIDSDLAQEGTTVTIPGALFKMLLQIALANSDFDEETYFRENPDVRAALQRGDIESAQDHFVGFGYFEGRKGGTVVDEAWYLKKYPDVASGIKSGQISSAASHFSLVGGGEGRSPSSDHEAHAAQWKRVLARDK